jgi:hypothetical protein
MRGKQTLVDNLHTLASSRQERYRQIYLAMATTSMEINGFSAFIYNLMKVQCTKRQRLAICFEEEPWFGTKCHKNVPKNKCLFDLYHFLCFN